jgi:hypothetical protein
MKSLIITLAALSVFPLAQASATETCNSQNPSLLAQCSVLVDGNVPSSGAGANLFTVRSASICISKFDSLYANEKTGGNDAVHVYHVSGDVNATYAGASASADHIFPAAKSASALRPGDQVTNSFLVMAATQADGSLYSGGGADAEFRDGKLQMQITEMDGMDLHYQNYRKSAMYDTQTKLLTIKYERDYGFAFIHNFKTIVHASIQCQ